MASILVPPSATRLASLLLFALFAFVACVSAYATPHAAGSAHATSRTAVPGQATRRVFISAKAPPRVAVIVLLRPASLDDWRSAPAPNLHWLLQNGACALMNTRAARIPGDRSRESVASAALTLGAGARAACGVSDGVFVRAGDIVYPGVTAQALHERRTGKRTDGDVLLAPNWPRVLSANRRVGYRVSLGSLGAALRNAGVQLSTTAGPSAPLVAANGDGVAGAPIISDDFLRAAPTRDTVAFLDAPPDWREADHLVGEVLAYSASHNARILVLSPAVDDHEYEAGERLAPLVSFGRGVPRGLLTSRSTRMPGLIANTDFAPAVAGYFGATLPGAGPARDLTIIRGAHSQDVLTDIQQKSWKQRQGMKVLPVFAVIAGLLVIAVSLLRLRGAHITPAVVLLPAIAISTFALSENVVEIVLFSAAPVGMLLNLRRSDGVQALRWVCGLIWATAVIHMLAPHGVLKYSLLGYSVIEGARYYGLGNEMMGALAGAMLVVASGAEPAWARRLMLVLVLATVGMAGWPQIGAKAGGVIVSVGTMLVYVGTLRGVRWNAGRLALVAAAALAAVLAVAVMDSHLSAGRQSHLGQAVAGLGRSGGGEWMDIVTRKLAVEVRLLWRSAWAIPFWSALAAVIAMRGAVGDLESASVRATHRAGVAAILLSAVFNDAGAVAGALCALLLWSYLFLMTRGLGGDLRSPPKPLPSD